VGKTKRHPCLLVCLCFDPSIAITCVCCAVLCCAVSCLGALLCACLVWRMDQPPGAVSPSSARASSSSRPGAWLRLGRCLGRCPPSWWAARARRSRCSNGASSSSSSSSSSSQAAAGPRAHTVRRGWQMTKAAARGPLALCRLFSRQGAGRHRYRSSNRSSGINKPSPKQQQRGETEAASSLAGLSPARRPTPSSPSLRFPPSAAAAPPLFVSSRVPLRRN
jgi:hypothetical protein